MEIYKERSKRYCGHDPEVDWDVCCNECDMSMETTLTIDSIVKKDEPLIKLYTEPINSSYEIYGQAIELTHDQAREMCDKITSYLNSLYKVD